MIPHEISLIRRLYGKDARIRTMARPSALYQSIPCYEHLYSTFFNMSDDERAFLGANFHSLDDGLREYLVF